MSKVIMILISVLLTSTVYGGCEIDSAELGDNGPESLLVCNMLEQQHPYAKNIKVLDREPHSRSRVRVLIAVDNRQVSLLYDLVGANWRLTEFRPTAGMNPKIDLAY